MPNVGQSEKAREESSQSAQERRDNQFSDLFKKYIGLKTFVVIMAIGGIGIGLVYLTLGQEESLWHYLTRESGKALVLTALVSFGVNSLIRMQSAELERLQKKTDEHREAGRHEALQSALRSLEKELEVVLKELQAGIRKQTDRLVGSVSSLQALYEARAVRVFANRKQATREIKTALEDQNANSIKIIGISLNDFLRDEDVLLSEAWRTIEERSASRDNRELHIQILLLDPESHGARLRAVAEIEKYGDPARLFNDVNAAIDRLAGLINRSEIIANGTAANNGISIKIEARLYQHAPVLYLVKTPSVSFVQQYYFRPSHGADVNIPVFKFEASPSTASEKESMHHELDFHFNWIWDNASIDLNEYKYDWCHGVDSAITKACIKNMYYDTAKSRNRILRLIEDPDNKTLWIKGISLRSFFQVGSDLYIALLRACTFDGLDIRILLIDPESEQAQLRSFREYRIRHPEATFSDFSESEQHRQRLYLDTSASVEQIKYLKQRLKQKKSGQKFQARLFHSAPEAFMLLTDKVAIVEQYHYGKIAQQESEIDLDQKTLEGDVPLIEYGNRLTDGTQLSENPYRIFLDHFQYVFDHCSQEIREEQTQAEQDIDGRTEEMPEIESSSPA